MFAGWGGWSHTQFLTRRGRDSPRSGLSTLLCLNLVWLNLDCTRDRGLCQQLALQGTLKHTTFTTKQGDISRAKMLLALSAPVSICIFSSIISTYILWQKLGEFVETSSLVIISFIRMTCMFGHTVIL